MKKLNFIIKSLAFKAGLCFILAAIFLVVNPHFSIAYEKEINSLSKVMAEKIVTSGKNRVAVVDFTDLQGNVTELGRFIAEEFSVALAGAGKGFKVIDRVHLKSIIKEHKLSATGLIDPTTARQLGKIAGVEALVTGTITPFGESVRLAVKILDTATAEVIDANKGNIPKTEAIKELLAKGIEVGTYSTAPGRPSNRKAKNDIKLKKAEARNFTFELKECKISGRSITCKLLVTSNGQDRNLQVCGYSEQAAFWGDLCFKSPTMIFDNFGNRYTAQTLRLANDYGESKVSNFLVSGVPTRLLLTFGNTDPKANVVKLLHISCKYSKRKKSNFTVQFRNIPISK